jgi:hypothetical protein
LPFNPTSTHSRVWIPIVSSCASPIPIRLQVDADAERLEVRH